MIPILENYEINEKTKALIPQKHMEYRTLVIETGGKKYYINKTPIELIEHACIQGWSTLSGRRNAILKRTGFSRKVPILLDITRKIIAFPSKSPKSDECTWIFYHHILNILPDTKSGNSTRPSTTVLFKDGYKLHMEESYYIINNQYSRTLKFINMLPEYNEIV
ncbi:competence protein ComK [Radiobacillus kanasensis]|uniref:competence protein ComK n=1 Tax=Radiobacillus kanasensis TaxID=2844358 RepID=UPI001E29BD73|nr:competence protein ComK [Radiobacillus kanasensis]UFT98789.1 competence protein ComK [Radiobacillus kanasensis]